MAYVYVTQQLERGTLFKLYVDSNNGSFAAFVGDTVATYDNVFCHETTMEALKKKLKTRAAERAVKVAVPFCVISGFKVKRGVARAIHVRSKNVLITWQDGTKDELNSYRDVLRDLTPEEEAELNSLGEQAKITAELAAKALEPFKDKTTSYQRGRWRGSQTVKDSRLMDLRDAVTEAIKTKSEALIAADPEGTKEVDDAVS